MPESKDPQPQPVRHPMASWLYGIFVGLTVLALVWPGPMWVGQFTTPLILGLPPALAWNVGWVVLAFGALLTYHLTTHKDESP